VLALAVAFATLVARPLAPLRIGPVTMFLALITLQTTIHIACIAALDGGSAHGANAHMDMVMASGHISMSHPTAGMSMAASLAMLIGHLAVTVLGAAVLLTLEQHAWDLVRTTVRKLFTHHAPPVRAALLAAVPALCTVTLPRRRPVGTRLVRGPPSLRCSH
jgi:hypothetical protein